MKPILKKIALPVISAIVGGAIVIAVLKISPSVRFKFENLSATKNEDREMLFDDIIKKQRGINRQFDSLFSDDFFSAGDPFKEMKKMREQMRKQMNTFQSEPSMSNPFDSWYSDKFGGGSIEDITKREDDDFVYYDIKVTDVNSTSITTKTADGLITITGTTEKKLGPSEGKENSDLSSQGLFKSTFTRTFPLPEHVDSTKMKMSSEKDTVVLKFPKIKT